MSVATSSPSMTLPGGTRLAAATTSGTSAVRSVSPRSWRRTLPSSSRNRMQRRPSHLTSKRYSAELNGASAEAACMGRTSPGKFSSSIWSWSDSCTSPRLGESTLRGFTPSPGLGGGLLAPGALLLGLLDRLPQRFHEVHDLGRLRSLGGFDDLALHLGLHDLHDRLAVVVLVAAGVEVVGEALDQGLGHLELLRVDLHLALQPFEAFHRANLVGPVQRVHDQALAVGVQGGEVLLVAQRDLGDRHPAGRLERLAEQLIGLLSQLFRLDVVGAVVVEAWFDVIHRDELLDVDGVRGGQREVVQVLVVDEDIPVFADLVAALDLAVLDLVVPLGAPALVRDGGVVLRAELPERDLGGRLGRVVETDRYRHHPERDHALPHRSRHGDAVYLLNPCLATFRRRVRRLRPAAASQVSSFRVRRARAGASAPGSCRRPRSAAASRPT